jgi:hypothetical protein
MMDSFTHYFKSNLHQGNRSRGLGRWLLICVFGLLGGYGALAQTTAEIAQVRIERSEEDVFLSAEVHFELPSAVEDALLKGIPMVFVMSADTLRERWYWYDKKITSAERYFRLAYQPLTRRWRVNLSTGPVATTAVGLALNQSYDDLAQALSAIRRVSKWKIAAVADFDTSAKYRADFRFRLDLTQLPRPFQIGALGQNDWDISANTLLPFSLENMK